MQASLDFELIDTTKLREYLITFNKWSIHLEEYSFKYFCSELMF